MKEFEFTSQICTTREQSQRLLDMGLKPETADMVYHFTNSKAEAMQWELEVKALTLRGEFWTPERIAKLARHGKSGEEVFDQLWGKDVPAWSVSRLLELLPTTETISKALYIFAVFHEEDEGWTASYCGSTCITRPTLLEACIDMIERMIKMDGFNKEYLR